MTPETTAAAEDPARRVVVRDLLIFQFKLIIDGIVDLVLLPISVIVGLISVLKPGPNAGSEFYTLLRLGRQGERWINLFGIERKDGAATEEDTVATGDLDDLVAQVETFLVDEYRKRGATTHTRQRLDAALDSLRGLSQQRHRRKPD
jgi:hypothetical protein